MLEHWRTIAGVALLGGVWLVLAFSSSERAVDAPAASGERVEVSMNSAPNPPEQILPVPFPERRIRVPQPGEAVPSETAAYCDEANWRNTDIVVERLAPGAFAVDEAAWRRTLTGTRVGLASWMSQCHRSGAPIEIVSASTGAVLAVYDVFSGLHSPFD